ncbi:MAG: dihydrolipoamide acetyltransferase family protein [Chloroflexi bacterium]|nr:dihydrolipoamide acetyltransferase family protein [Chloroflexota bacterium]
MSEIISMPKLGFDMREGILVRWVKNEGDSIDKGDVLAEIETDKATVEVESSAGGVVRKLFASQGDSIPVGAAIAIIGTLDEKIDDGFGSSATTLPSVDLHPAEVATTLQSSSGVDKKIETVVAGPVKASPLARKVAKNSRVDLAQITGTGPGGRIVRRDIEASLQIAKSENLPSSVLLSADKPSIGISPSASTTRSAYSDETIQTSKLRQAIGRRLVESKQTSPHFYVSHEYKMDKLIELRKQINGLLPEGQKISVNDFIIKAVALALRQFPNLNSTLHGTEIVQYGAVNVGVAVTVPGGLLTVVIKNTDQKHLGQISMEIKNMAARARDGKIKPEDVDGSTFSTSNLGMYDVENFTAIINPPEAAILAIGSSREMPVVENGQIKIGNRMKCTISVDHRISDGAEAAQFMQAVAHYLEEPLRLML